MNETIPNPGSDEGHKQGCTCATIDNGHGKGCGRFDERGKPLFWLSGNCPLHGADTPYSDNIFKDPF